MRIRISLVIVGLFLAVGCSSTNPYLSKIDKSGWISPEAEREILVLVSPEIAEEIHRLRVTAVASDLDTSQVVTLADAYINLCELIQDGSNPYFQFAATRGLHELDVHAKRGGTRPPSFKARVGVLKLMLNRSSSARRYLDDSITLDRSLEKEFLGYLLLAKNYDEKFLDYSPWLLNEYCGSDHTYNYVNNTNIEKNYWIKYEKTISRLCLNGDEFKAGMRIGDVLIRSRYKTSDEKYFSQYIEVMRRGKLVEIGPMHTKELVFGGRIFKDNNGRGLKIDEVYKGSFAERVGIVSGDIIVLLDGKSINDIVQLERDLKNKNKGDSGKFTVLRNGKELSEIQFIY